MRLPNHLAGGFCLTGFFSAVFFSVNVLASPVTIAAVLVGSVFPDADNPKSLAGRLVYPVARWLNRKVGHRTLTHSLVFMAGLAVLSSVVEKTFFGEVKISIVLVTAWFVHVVLDTFTLQGVQLMFPFSFEPYWMFDKHEARMRNGDFRAEAGFFLAFAVLTFAQGDLWRNGFWTSYNQQFGTIANLESEMRRSQDALLVTAFAKRGTEDVRETGLLVELKPSGMVLMTESGFVEVGDDEVFQHAAFEHSGEQVNFRQQSLISVSADSLNQVLMGKHIASLEVAANQPFTVTRPGRMPATLSQFSESYLFPAPTFAEIAPTLTLDTFIEDRAYLAEISEIEAEIQRIQRTQAQADDAQRKHGALVESLRRDFAASADVAERQRLHERISELEKQKAPGDVSGKVEELRARIAKIRAENSMRSEAKRREVEARNLNERAKVQPTVFTGIVRFVETGEPGQVPVPQPGARLDSVKVIGIRDGDTIEVIDSNHQMSVVRLAHIDCPESHQAFGAVAKKFTSDFCFRQMVTLEVTDMDNYGRLIGIIRVGSRELNLALVQNGLAWHYKKYSPDQKYARAEDLARSQKKGLWSHPNPVPPWEFRKQGRQ